MYRVCSVVRLALALLAALAAVLPAYALVAAPSPIAQRVANARTVLVGKVTAIEEKTVSATQWPGAPEKVEYSVAVVKIEEAILGGKDLTHIKVGYVLPRPPQPGAPIVSSSLRGNPQLTVGQEVCLFLKPHHEAKFQIAPMYFDIIDSKNPNFAKEVEQARKAAKLLADPKAGLTAKDAGDRLTTAHMLLSRYRMVPGPNFKTEPIDAEESKLILKAIAGGDWTKGFSPTEVTAQMTFNMLGLRPEDGWNPRFRRPNEFPEAAKKWLAEHAETHRIQKFVPGKSDNQ
jgi:hypothetical protein